MVWKWEVSYCWGELSHFDLPALEVVLSRLSFAKDKTQLCLSILSEVVIVHSGWRVIELWNTRWFITIKICSLAPFGNTPWAQAVKTLPNERNLGEAGLCSGWFRVWRILFCYIHILWAGLSERDHVFTLAFWILSHSRHHYVTFHCKDCWHWFWSLQCFAANKTSASFCTGQ